MIGSASNRTALVLAAHGERGGEKNDAATLAFAERMREIGGFGEVTCGFFKTRPHLKDVLDEMGEEWEQIVVAPLLMADGFFSRKALPRAVNASTHADRIIVAEPIGLLPEAQQAVADDAARLALSLRPQHHHIVVVGHGSPHHPESRASVYALVELLKRQPVFASVATAFLDDSPTIAETLAEIRTPAIVLPYFWSAGLHAKSDLRMAIEGRETEFHIAPPVSALNTLPEILAETMRLWPGAAAIRRSPVLCA